MMNPHLSGAKVWMLLAAQGYPLASPVNVLRIGCHRTGIACLWLFALCSR